MLKALLAHPLTRGLDLDDPGTTALRQQIIAGKPFLKRIYDEWYASIASALPGLGDLPLPAFELGSGAGYMERFVPDLITSDVFACGALDVVTDARQMPFRESSLRGIAMVDVLHHVPQVERFFEEAQRCVAIGGAVAMVEPWVTPWSRLIYQRLHHEPFVPEAADWSIPNSGPLSGANGALPWILFERDRAAFESRFPMLRIESVTPILPLRYLLSGGVSMRSLQPGIATGFWKQIERAMLLAPKRTAMFAKIVLRRV